MTFHEPSGIFLFMFKRTVKKFPSVIQSLSVRLRSFVKSIMIRKRSQMLNENFTCYISIDKIKIADIIQVQISQDLPIDATKVSIEDIIFEFDGTLIKSL